MLFYITASALINCIASTLFGLLVLVRNPYNKVNYSFALYAFCAALWSLAYFFWQISGNYSDALFWSRALMAFAIFVPAFYSHFVFVLTGLTRKKTFLLILAYLLLGLFLPFDIFGFYFIAGVQELMIFKFWPIAGPLFSIFLVIWMGYVIYDTYLLYDAYKKSSGIFRNQIKYIFWGLALAFLGGITNYFLWYEIPIPPYGNILVSAYVGLTAYAIIKHRFLDIRLVVARTVAYTLLVVLFGAFYTGSIYWISRSFLAESVSSNQALVSAVLALFIAFTFQPLKNFLEKITEKIFFRTNYSSNELLSRLTKIMASTLDLRNLTQSTLHELLNIMHISHGTFLIFDNGNIYPPVYEGFSTQPHYNVETIKKFSDLKRIVIFEEEEDESLKDLMRQFDFSLSLPLYVGDKLHGLLVLGEKKSGDLYSTQDIEVLGIFGPEISVAVQNSKAYEEIRRFNITLKDEVNKATKDLQTANDKLKELDQLKDDFVSVASHELRTPMTAIKSYLWMALKKPDAPLSEKMNKYLDRAYISTERLINLVNDMLNVSRIESGRIEIRPLAFNMEKLVDDVMLEVNAKASEKSVALHVLKGQIPQVFADTDKVHQILLNLIGNSLKFTPEGGSITLSFFSDGKTLETSVKDSGVGMSKDDLSRLFQKFGRLDNSYVAAATSGGTGLGLFISKSLVELMGGKIWAASEGVNKGATFTFSLPVATPDIIAKAEQFTKKVSPGEAKILEPVAI